MLDGISDRGIHPAFGERSRHKVQVSNNNSRDFDVTGEQTQVFEMLFWVIQKLDCNRFSLSSIRHVHEVMLDMSMSHVWWALLRYLCLSYRWPTACARDLNSDVHDVFRR